MLAIDSPTADGRAAPIAVDGVTEEWDGLRVSASDPAGDAGRGGIDLISLGVANDRRNLYIRVKLRRELVLQEANRLTLYIDGDFDGATGDMGAEFSWSFGERRGLFFDTMLHWVDAGIITAPAHSAKEFEISIPRNATVGGSPIFSSKTIRLAMRDLAGGDRIPDDDASVEYTFDETIPFDAEPIPIAREKATDVRILTYNVLRDSPWIRYAEYNRIFDALDPDIIAFQEIYNHTGNETKSRVASRLRGRWYQAWDGGQLHTVSRFPFIGAWVASPGRAWATLIDLPDRFENDLLLINMHLSCCSNDGARQQQIDEVMAFVRDAREGGSDAKIGRNTAIILVGDANMYGDSRQVKTLLTGDIANNAAYGADFRPDWDGTDLTALLSRQNSVRQDYTWYDERNEYGPGHIDRISYTDSRVNVAKSFILHTPLLEERMLIGSRLRRDDTRRASDHLPHVLDIRGGEPPVESGGVPSLPPYLTALPNPFNPATTLSFRLQGEERATLAIYDVAGRRVETLISERLGAGPHFFTWTPDGRVPSGTYFARLEAGKRSDHVKITLVR